MLLLVELALYHASDVYHPLAHLAILDNFRGNPCNTHIPGIAAIVI